MTYGGIQFVPEIAPQGAFGNFFSGIAPSLGGAIGGAFGQQQLGSAIGQGAAPLLRLLPFQVDPMQAAYGGGQVGGGQLAPAGWFGNLVSGLAPVAGRIAGGTAGNVINTVGGLARLLPFEADPMQQAYANQQQQLAPAGWFGNLVGGLAPVAGRIVGGNAGNVINTVGGLARLLPFEVDPMQQAYANQQQQLAPAGWFGNLVGGLAPGVGRLVGGNAGNVINTVGGLARLLPFEVDPMQQAYASQQQQLAPAGWFGNLVGGIAPGVGRLVGGNAGNVINTVGGLARLLPFEADPMQQAYAGYGNPAYANATLAPQGLFGGILGGFGGGHAGRAIGGLFGRGGADIGSTIGSTIGGIAGGLLPFQVDPVTAAYTRAQYGYGY